MGISVSPTAGLFQTSCSPFTATGSPPILSPPTRCRANRPASGTAGSVRVSSTNWSIGTTRSAPSEPGVRRRGRRPRRCDFRAAGSVFRSAVMKRPGFLRRGAAGERGREEDSRGDGWWVESWGQSRRRPTAESEIMPAAREAGKSRNSKSETRGNRMQVRKEERDRRPIPLRFLALSPFRLLSSCFGFRISSFGFPASGWVAARRASRPRPLAGVDRQIPVGHLEDDQGHGGGVVVAGFALPGAVAACPGAG